MDGDDAVAFRGVRKSETDISTTVDIALDLLDCGLVIGLAGGAERSHLAQPQVSLLLLGGLCRPIGARHLAWHLSYVFSI